MTLGFAAAIWPEKGTGMVMVVADSRYSDAGSTLTDNGVKTYELGGTAGMVAAGQALPAVIAAEVVRPVIENHNRRSDSPMGFYDTVRLLAFFMRRAAREQPWKCQVAVAGFLQSGPPCLASVIVSPERNRVQFQSLQSGSSVAIPVGNLEGKMFLLQGMAAARREKRPVLASGVSLLWYMSRHPGAFLSIGGGISVGICERDTGHFSWPIIKIGGRCFLRGVDITDCMRPGWPAPEVISYDESWCAALDQQLHRDQQLVQHLVEVQSSGYEIDAMSMPENLFQMRTDPIAFENGIACAG